MDIPPELFLHIALRLPIEDLIRICRTNQRLRRYTCGDHLFWMKRLQIDYGVTLTDPSSPEEYRTEYMRLYRRIGWFVVNRHGGVSKVIPNVKQLSNAENTLYVLDNNGVLWGMGRNIHHQITHTGLYIAQLTQIATPNVTVSHVSNKDEFVFIVDTNGIVWGKGNNTYRQIADHGDIIHGFTRPSNQPGNIISVHCGDEYVVALGADNRVWISGEIWTSGKYKSGFRELHGISFQVAKISCGFLHILFIDTSGNLWGVGGNNYGQLGIIDRRGTVKRPQRISQNIVEISCNGMYSLVLEQGGHVYFSGYYNKDVSSYTFANIFNGAIDISAGRRKLLIVDGDHNVWQQESKTLHLSQLPNMKAWRVESGIQFTAFYGYIGL